MIKEERCWPPKRYKLSSQFYTPPEQFDGCFTTFYHLTLEMGEGDTITDYLQPEWGNIRFFAGHKPSARIAQSKISQVRFAATGPSSLPCQFELGAARMWGIGFLPVGWSRFMDGHAGDHINIACHGATHPVFAKFSAMTPVLTDLSVSSEEQFAHIVEVMGSLMRPNREEAKIGRVHQAIVQGRHSSVRDLADHSAMSVRTLERVCRRYFGFTPKLLLRRQRFMRSLTSFMLHEGRRWTDVMDAEYHDQAQFTREFREFMTMLPSDYASLEHPIIGSFMEARARIWGSAAQTLDAPGDKAVG